MKKSEKKSLRTKKTLVKNPDEEKGALSLPATATPAKSPGRIPHEVREIARQIGPFVEHILLPRRVVMQIADEVVERLARRRRGKEKKIIKAKLESPLFLDTSAIIDERLFDLIKLGVLIGNLVVLESVLAELKNIADSKDDAKRERGRRAMKRLEEIKKQKGVKLVTLSDEDDARAVDEKIIHVAKQYKGRLVTCDFNLARHARLSSVTAIDIHEVANALKTPAVPGETFFVKVVQEGKGQAQGVGYLPDGTMLVVEEGAALLGKTVKVEVSRIIQTEAGKILFSKIISGS